MEILSAAIVLPMVDEPILNGAVAIEGSTIIDVGTLAELKARFPQAKHEDFEQACILPGLVNAHTHLDLTFFPPSETSKAGEMIRTNLDFISWLGSVILYRTSLVEQ